MIIVDVTLGGTILLLFLLGGGKARGIIIALAVLLLAIGSSTARYCVAGFAVLIGLGFLLERYADKQTTKHFIEKYGNVEEWGKIPDMKDIYGGTDNETYYKGLFPEDWKKYHLKMQWRIAGPIIVIVWIIAIIAIIVSLTI